MHHPRTRGGGWELKTQNSKLKTLPNLLCHNEPVLTVDDLRTALATYRPAEVPLEQDMARAAVAAILRRGAPGPEVLFIRRADQPQDPWSGHMAFPGGRVDPGDEGPLAAALRETREEVGLDLETAGERLGRLSEVRAIGRGRPLSMVICPFVFALDADPVLVTNHEVGAVVWVPLSFLADRRNRDTMQYRRGGLELELPCYHFGEYLIWGMTLGMVDELLAIADR